MSAEERFNVVHFAVSASCACGQAILGSITRTSDPDYVPPIIYYGGDRDGDPVIQHTCIKEDVTCPKCKNTTIYKSYTD